MATIALTLAANVISSTANLSPFFSGLLAVGAGIAGQVIDDDLFQLGTKYNDTKEGPRVEEAKVSQSTEGTPISRTFGRFRVGGNVIWATKFQEHTHSGTDTTPSTGGKGSSRRTQAVVTPTLTYTYSVSFAVALCEGEIADIGTIWADGKKLDLRNMEYRVYKGTQDQGVDPKILAIEGADFTPAYRGLAYIVFENFDLEKFGRRMPQINVEVIKASETSLEEVEHEIKAIEVGPSLGEYTYAFSYNSFDDGPSNIPSNDPVGGGNAGVIPGAGPDNILGYDVVDATYKAQGITTILNRHSSSGKSDIDTAMDRLESFCPNIQHVMVRAGWFGSSLHTGSCAIERRVESNIRVVEPPHHDIPGRAGLKLAPAGHNGTPADRSILDAVANTRFRGTKATFSPDLIFSHINGRVEDMTFNNDNDINLFFNNSYVPMIRHYANLLVGQIDTFILGSNFRSLEDNATFVNNMISLAALVKGILGAGVKITYNASYQNYNSEELRRLWQNSNIFAIGINNYMPLTDWRDGINHIDDREYDTPYDQKYLTDRIKGGEGWHWTYTNDADRLSQNRTYLGTNDRRRYKDIQKWVGDLNKPVWFTSLGCVSVDKGSNDPSALLPMFSSGTRDDYMQRSVIKAHLKYWKDSSLVDSDRIYISKWDARPYPIYPFTPAVWKDNHEWGISTSLSGKLGSPELKDFVGEVTKGFKVDVDSSRLQGLIKGYQVNNVNSPRSILQPIMSVFLFDAFESEGIIKFAHRGLKVRTVLGQEDLVEDSNSQGGSFQITRAQTSEIADSVNIRYVKEGIDYKTASIAARRLTQKSRRVVQTDAPVLLDQSEAQEIADVQLFQAWIGREKISLKLPPSLLRLDATDLLRIILNDRQFEFRLTELGYEHYRPATGIQTQAETYNRVPGPVELFDPLGSAEVITGIAALSFLDIPLIRDEDAEHAPWIATTSTPWPGGINVFRSPAELIEAYVLDTSIAEPSVTGLLTSPLGRGEENVWDEDNTITVRVSPNGSLQSLEEEQVFSGHNIGAIRNTVKDNWEIVQWVNAELIAPNTYKLSRLLRAQFGTEAAMANEGEEIPAGERFVILSDSVTQSSVSLNAVNIPQKWQHGPSSEALGDNSYVETDFEPKGIGLKPLSVTDLEYGMTDNEGEFSITWTRRTRKAGDTGWDRLEVPLSEKTELYSIDVINPSTGEVLQTINDITSPEYIFTPQRGVFDVEVFQVSEIFGRGEGIRITVQN